MPRVERQRPPYVQVTNHYRDLIMNGDLRPGERLPTISAIAEEWGVARATASKAVGQLQVEGLIYTSPQGSFVGDPFGTSRTPRDRITTKAPHRPGSNGETITVTAAEIVDAPPYVADLLGVEPRTQIIRREEIVSCGGRARALTVDWIPADRETGAELLERKPIEGGPIALIERTTGHHVVHGRDYVRGRACDGREADALRLPVGSPILAGTHVWSDDDTVLLYGEWCLPPDQVISYEYAVHEEDNDAQ